MKLYVFALALLVSVVQGCFWSFEGGKNFALHEVNLTAFQAWCYCGCVNQSLASMHGIEEYLSFSVSTASSKPAWINLYRIPFFAKWTWMDGGAFQADHYKVNINAGSSVSGLHRFWTNLATHLNLSASSLDEYFNKLIFQSLENSDVSREGSCAYAEKGAFSASDCFEKRLTACHTHDTLDTCSAAQPQNSHCYEYCTTNYADVADPYWSW